MTTDPVNGSPADPPAPDPGNSPPEDWAEDLNPDELVAILERLKQETS